MKRALCLFLIVLTTITFSSCDKDDSSDFFYVSLPVASVKLPPSFKVNETYQINVTYQRPNECTYFEGFDIAKLDKTARDVVVVGSTFPNDGSCSEISEEFNVSFNFLVLYTDTYVFRFWTGENENGESEYLEIEVPVTTE